MKYNIKYDIRIAYNRCSGLRISGGGGAGVSDPEGRGLRAYGSLGFRVRGFGEDSIARDMAAS